MILAKRLHDLLKMKDQRAPEEGKGWLEDVAKACTVNENGTFKKALWRRFQYVVAPILAEVIAYVDRDGNLELAASKDPWLSNLWLNVFEDSSFATINYGMFMTREEDVDVVRSKVPVLKSGYRGHVFQCRFPFSWMLKERIDELYRVARSVAGEINEKNEVCVCVCVCVCGVSNDLGLFDKLATSRFQLIYFPQRVFFMVKTSLLKEWEGFENLFNP